MKNKIIVQCGIKIEDGYWFFPEGKKLTFRQYSDMTLVYHLGVSLKMGW